MSKETMNTELVTKLTKEQLDKANQIQFQEDLRVATEMYNKVLEKTGFGYMPRLTISPDGGIKWSLEIVKVK